MKKGFLILGTPSRLKALKAKLDRMDDIDRNHHIASYRAHAKNEGRLAQTDKQLRKWGYL